LEGSEFDCRFIYKFGSILPGVTVRGIITRIGVSPSVQFHAWFLFREPFLFQIRCIALTDFISPSLVGAAMGVRKGIATAAEGEASATKHFEKGLKSKEKGDSDEACRLLRSTPSVAAQFLGAIRLAVKRQGGDLQVASYPVKKE
jgi:hypothetical protein